ncbi:MAG TPA: hypothetical protein VNT75_20635 [Symbiobacteriaceae bacterium]|nr:hypothetical protein [Symbiobacteriaceae bacterium]
MKRNRLQIVLAAGLGLLVGGLVWVVKDQPVSLPEGGVAAGTGANVLGVEWVNKGQTTAAPTGSGGLGVDWVNNSQTTPAPTGSGGLDVTWAGEASLGEAAIRRAYQQVFGREPTSPELAKELDRQSYDQKLRTLPALVAALRTHLNAPSSQAEREATVARAVAAAPGDRNLVANSGLIYSEMVRRLTIYASYQTAFGRVPSAAEERQWPESPAAAAMLSAHRTAIRQDAAVRKAVVDQAYRTIWKRQPVAEELQQWDRDLQSSGKTFAELTAAIAGGSDPIMPQAPLVLRHASRLANSYWPATTTLFWQQRDDRTDRFRVLRQNPPSYDWKEVGTQAPAGAGQELSFADGYQADRALYRVCAVNRYGEACSDQYATTDKPNRVRMNAARAESPTRIRLDWDRVGDDVTATAVRRQKPDGGWEEVFREAARPFTAHMYFDSVPPASSRTYVVCAFNRNGETCTPWLIVETPRPAVAAPADLKAEALNQTDWRITWRPQNGDPVRLQRRNGASGQWELLADLPAGGEASHLRRELGADPAYEYRACAYNGTAEACTPSLIVGKQFDHPTNFTNLDYGIYWFKCGTCRGSTKKGDEGTQSDGAKAVPGLSREYFDPARPTVLYVHGWARNSVKEFGRESMKSPTDKQDLMAAWQKAGWNVGVFYWNAFSDDDWGLEPRFAEGKIDKGDITWSVSDGRGGSSFAPTRVKDPAAVLFAGAIIDAMQEFRGPEFRIVGHSLGTQMAVMGTYYVSKSSAAHLTPSRVALLDPWISSGLRAEGLGGLIDQVKQSRRTVFEYYQTSVISQEHGQYGARAVTTRVHPMYAAITSPNDAHAAAIHWYFNSMGFVGESPTAGMTLDRLRPLMDCGCRFEQVGGKDTKPVSDDTFQRYKK